MCVCVLSLHHLRVELCGFSHLQSLFSTCPREGGRVRGLPLTLLVTCKECWVLLSIPCKHWHWLCFLELFKKTEARELQVGGFSLDIGDARGPSEAPCHQSGSWVFKKKKKKQARRFPWASNWKNTLSLFCAVLKSSNKAVLILRRSMVVYNIAASRCSCCVCVCRHCSSCAFTWACVVSRSECHFLRKLL